MASSLSDVGQDDILLWPDGFWCFREEFNAGFMRGEDYLEVLRQSEDWVTLTRRSCMSVTPSTDAPALDLAAPSFHAAAH